jgi:transposase
MDGSHIDAKKRGCRHRSVAGQPRQTRLEASPDLRRHGNGTPLHVLTSGANVPDISRALDLLDGVPPIAGCPGRPRRRFDVLLADKGYDSDAFRQACRERGTEPSSRNARPPGSSQGPEQVAVRRRTELRPAAPVPPARRALGTTPGHPRRFGQPGLRPDLLAPPDQLDQPEIFLGPLNCSVVPPPRRQRAAIFAAGRDARCSNPQRGGRDLQKHTDTETGETSVHRETSSRASDRPAPSSSYNTTGRSSGRAPTGAR